MKILLCGGGTGGHITPILAVAHEIKLNNPEVKIIYIGEYGGKFSYLTKDNNDIDQVKTVYGGKLRRYHNESWLRRILDVKTNYFNLRDFFLVIVGTFQSYRLIRKEKPNSIFIKGGYVAVPIGLAAHFTNTPFITHDSDALQSLTTKIIGKWAVYNATGMPGHLYSYPKDKIRYVGVPVASSYVNVTKELKNKYRNELNIPKNAKLLLVTGGSLGAIRLNKAFHEIIDQIFEQVKDLYVIHQVGKGKLSLDNDKNYPNLKVVEFISDMYKYSAAADVVMTRSGATTMAELATQGKSTIVIPNPELTGGHQTKNAEQLIVNNSALVISEDKAINSPNEFAREVIELLNDQNKQIKLAYNLQKEAVNDSASRIAMLLLSLVR